MACLDLGLPPRSAPPLLLLEVGGEPFFLRKGTGLTRKASLDIDCWDWELWIWERLPALCCEGLWSCWRARSLSWRSMVVKRV